MSGLTELLNGAAEAAVDAETPADPTERAELADAAEHAGVAFLGLASRLRAVADSDCEPPGLDGLCPLCARKLAEPVGIKAGHGCNPFDFVTYPVIRLRRLAVRTYRLGRLMVAAALHKAGV